MATYILISAERLPEITIGGPGGQIPHYTYELTFFVFSFWRPVHQKVKRAYSLHDVPLTIVESHWRSMIGKSGRSYKAFVVDDIVYYGFP